MTRSSSLLFGCLLAFNLALVAWWSWFQVHEARELETAGRLLAAGDSQGAARALGADSIVDLPERARARRRMFVSEGIAFAIITLLAGAYVLAALRRQARLAADHDRFLAGATHELKTPLATITLLLESLRDDRLPAHKRTHYLNSGLFEAQRLERGLTNVLTAAGLRATSRRPVQRSEGDLAADIDRAIAAITPRAEAAGIGLHSDAPQPVLTLRDPEAMQLVLHNLLDNAVKYSPRGSQVSVSLRAEGNEAVVSVHDQGQGMNDEVLQHAFEPFWRGRDTATGGTGLGLHLVRELVRAHGGAVQASSQGQGRGSEITVRLPRRAGSA